MSIFDFMNKGNKKLNESAPDEASLLKYIANLTPDDIDRLVSITKNVLSSDNIEERSKSLTEYFDLLHSVYGSTNFNTIGNSPQTRNQRYEIYDEMDESVAYISSALDIMSDDATQADEGGSIIHVKSASSKVDNLVKEFIKDFELEERVPKWARAIAKYGDLFVKVEGEYTKGVTYVNDTIYPGVVDRRDMNGKLVAFASNQDIAYTNESLYAPWEFVHFRHKGDIYKEESSYAGLGLMKDQFNKNLTSAYGQFVLRPAIKVYAQLRFVENMILLSRLTNSIRRNIFLVNVGEVSPDKAFETIQNYANLLKKDVNLNIEEGIYSAAKHTINYDEDIFIPVSDPQNDVRIEQVGGDANIKEQYDLEYLLNKLFAALKVPKAYLNYEQDLNARATLVQLDIRYARSVSQLQTTIVSGLRRLINIHLAYLGLDPDEIDLEVTLTPVSDINEESRADQQQKTIANARDLWDLLLSMRDSIESDEPMNLEGAREYIMRDYLGLSQQLIDKALGRPTAEEDSPLSRINSGKSYNITDGHADYPRLDKSSEEEFKRLKESLILNNEKHEPSE